MKQLPHDWVFFKELVQRGMAPSDIVLGCMFGALVCSGEVEQVVDLLVPWMGQVEMNTVIYTIVIKGFATSLQPDRALDLCAGLAVLGGRHTPAPVWVEAAPTQLWLAAAT